MYRGKSILEQEFGNAGVMLSPSVFQSTEDGNDLAAPRR